MAITPSQWLHVLTIPESYTPSAATSGQTLVITESVIAKLSAPDQSIFWSNVQNGGGDVRICTDSGGVNQLPVEVVSLDNSAQTCVIWTRKPSFDGTGNLYLFIGKDGETQPPVTDSFGRNAVWQDNAATYNLNDNSGKDSTGNNDLLVLGAPTTVSGVFGDALRFNSGTDLLEGSFSGLGVTQRTLKVWLRPDSVTDNRYLSTFNGGGRQNLTALLLGFQSGNFNVFDEGYPTGSAPDTQIPASALQWQRLVYTWNGSILKGYINGVEQISVSAPLFNQTPDFLRISPTSGGGVNFYVGGLQLFEALDYAQSDSFISTEYANQSDPATFFGTPTLSTTGGGLVDYTIPLDSGNYLLQGDTLALLSDRNLVIENGSYSLTGQELDLALQRSITLSQGVYSQQGTDTSLLVDRSLRLNTGDYLLDGSLLNLLLERSISLQSGEYDYAGISINLQYGREFRLSLEQGSYSLQGSDSLLLKEHILSLDSSSYTYSADNISLLANRKITTDSGDYSYSGSPINFIYEAGGITYTLSIDAGSYSLTGESLKLLASRRLPIDFGTYTYEGIDSKLNYNRVVALDSGVYSSAGTDLGIKVNRRLVFDNGNYSLQGTPITLSYTGEVLAILEGYNLSYKKHPVQSKYKTYNITARYN